MEQQSISLSDIQTHDAKMAPDVLKTPKKSQPQADLIPIPKTATQEVQGKTCRFTAYKYQAFFLTGLLYAFFHAMRTVWGYIKPSLKEKDPFYTSSKLGFLDLAFTVAYAIGLYVSGWLGDRINLKKFLTIGTLMAVAGLSFFGIFEGYFSIKRMGFDIFAFILNGLGQSSGYPGCISIISNWFGTHKTGLIFGLWGINLNVGNILGQQIGRLVVNHHWHWANALIITCIGVSIALAILVFCVKIHPKELKENNSAVVEENTHQQPNEAGDLECDVNNNSVQTTHLTVGPQTQAQGLGFMKAWKIKSVPQYAFAFFCIKGVIYGILFWLPTYLVDQLKIEGDISSLLASIEIGQVFGSVALGLISDKIKSRPIAITFGFLFAVVFLLITSVTPSHANRDIFSISFFLAGFGLGGPASLISGAVSSDLGKMLLEVHNINGISTITGIMEGCGAAGAALTQLFIANFTSITFPFFAGLCGLGGLLIAPMAMEDFKKRKEALAPPAKQILEEKLEPEPENNNNNEEIVQKEEKSNE